MQIQNNPGVNFNANLITKTTRFYKSGKTPKTEVIEVFKLDKSDIPFAEKCCNELGKYHRRDLLSLQKKIRGFFEDFIQEKKSVHYDYYLAVKNNKEIAGGVVASLLGSKTYVVDAFAMRPKDSNMDILTYGYLSSIEKSYPVFSIETNNLLNGAKCGKTEILTSSIRREKEKIRDFYPTTHFQKGCAEKASLDEIFGTGDFEVEVNPHLK